MRQNPSNGEWYPIHEPEEEEINLLLRKEAIPELDYGRPTLLDRLLRRKTRKSMEQLRAQLAEVIKQRRAALEKLNKALVRAINNSGKETYGHQ